MVSDVFGNSFTVDSLMIAHHVATLHHRLVNGVALASGLVDGGGLGTEPCHFVSSLGILLFPGAMARALRRVLTAAASGLGRILYLGLDLKHIRAVPLVRETALSTRRWAWADFVKAVPAPEHEANQGP
jgi:hypothetical protein